MVRRGGGFGFDADRADISGSPRAVHPFEKPLPAKDLRASGSARLEAFQPGFGTHFMMWVPTRQTSPSCFTTSTLDRLRACSGSISSTV